VLSKTVPLQTSEDFRADNFKTKLKSIGAGIQHGKAPFHFISPIARETFIGIIKDGSLADLRRLQVNI